MTEAILVAVQAVSFVVSSSSWRDGQHDGDDRAGALRRVRDDEGALR
jgi:hypothetical protein